MVSFFIVETGLPEGRSNNDHSVQWENAFMDIFFDAGYIVSNSPIVRLQTNPQDDLLRSAGINIMETRNWGVDYVVIAQLDYVSLTQSPEKISFIIYRVNTNEKIFDRQIDGKSYRSVREEYDDIRSIVRALVPFIKS